VIQGVCAGLPLLCILVDKADVFSVQKWSSRRWSTWGHFSLKSGHDSQVYV